MSKLFMALISTVLCSCTVSSTRTSLAQDHGPLSSGPSCTECRPCPDICCPPEECPLDCGDECTIVCVDPICGECVVTFRCDGDTCTVVSCEPLAPGASAPAHARRVDCSVVCATSCAE